MSRTTRGLVPSSRMDKYKGWNRCLRQAIKVKMRRKYFERYPHAHLSEKQRRILFNEHWPNLPPTPDEFLDETTDELQVEKATVSDSEVGRYDVK